MATNTRPARLRRTGGRTQASFRHLEDPVGIQVGTAITTLVRKADHTPAEAVGFRHLWGQAKREELIGDGGGGTGKALQHH